MPKATKAQLAKLDKLDVKAGGLMMAVFKCAPTTDVKFADCLKLAPPELAQAYRDAKDAYHAYQQELINDGRAYRDAYSTFTLYSK